MNKQNIINLIAKQFDDVCIARSEQIINSLIEIILKEVRENNQVKISGLGTFSLKEVKERKGINPQTKEPMQIPAFKTIKFKTSETVKKLLNQK